VTLACFDCLVLAAVVPLVSGNWWTAFGHGVRLHLAAGWGWVRRATIKLDKENL
jgi:hypothetical protein